MAHWLFKQEPDCYSFADLERDGQTVWDGVSNALALKHLRAVAVGDSVLYYHTGKEKAVVGVIEVTAAELSEDNVPTITVKPVRKFEHPVTLASIKAEATFAEWELVRISRLSVMPVTVTRWKKIEQLAKAPKPEAKKPEAKKAVAKSEDVKKPDVKKAVAKKPSTKKTAG